MARHPDIDPDSSLWAWLAYDLRFYREKYELSQAAMGRIIRRSPTNLSNCEAGRRRITDKEAKALDIHSLVLTLDSMGASLSSPEK